MDITKTPLQEDISHIPMAKSNSISMWVGPKGHWEGVHFDPDSNFHLCVRGYKKFILLPPECYEYVRPILSPAKFWFGTNFLYPNDGIKLFSNYAIYLVSLHFRSGVTSSLGFSYTSTWRFIISSTFLVASGIIKIKH